MTADNDNGSERRGTNGFDPQTVKNFTDRVENLHDDLLREQSEYMSRCKVIREDIRLVVQEAKDAGIPKKEFRTVIKARQLEEKIEKLREELEGDQQQTYDMLRLSLGDLADTPLGGAALAKAPDRPSA